MKTIFLDCSMGAAGDMLGAALLELLPDPGAFLSRMNSLGLPAVTVSAEKSVRCGITGTHLSVSVGGREEDHCAEEHGHHHHSHAGMEEIEHTIRNLDLPENVRGDALAVYRSVAEAESEVHGVPVSEIHFHEVGMLDAIADVVGFALLLHELKPDCVVSSPVCVGSGQISCAHGILPVPAPATALLLRGIPSFAGAVSGEMCTPTGAALLRHFAEGFAPMPPMTVEKIGYGMGSRENGTANCVRAMLGSSEAAAPGVTELCCNLDDMTPEEIAFAEERLFAAGALDVWTTAVQMKKNRPGIVLSCLCRDELRETIVRALFRNTATLGVRWSHWNRTELERSEYVASAAGRPVRIKLASGEGVRREKPEYEDLAAAARESGLSLAEVKAMLKKSPEK